jgi:hypothetical protein
LVLSLAILSVCPLAPTLAAGREPRDPDYRVIERSFSAEKVREFSVKGHVGRIRITTSPSADIRLRLELRAKSYRGWFFSQKKGDPHAADVAADARGDVLGFGLRYEDDRDGLDETWILDVPARLAADLDLVVGGITVRGLAGGLRLKVNVGDIEADVPEGSIAAETNVGDIRVTSATSSYGAVDLKANVGDTDLNLPGGRVRHRKAPGPGDSTSIEGNGRDRIRLQTNVGDASLSLRAGV